MIKNATTQATNNNEGSTMTKDAAKTIRTELKAQGIKRSQVSVRCDHSSIRVNIIDPTVSKKTVEEIAGKYESIDRCNYSGEILCGGNTFVFVEYSSEAGESVLAQQPARIEAICNAANALEDLYSVEVEGVFVRRDCNQYTVQKEMNDGQPCWINPAHGRTVAHAICVADAV
jgi:hypothetical protein